MRDEPFGGTSVSGTSTGSAFGFTGRENDGTGLYFYRARYYDPRLQRFVSEDPIGFAMGELSLYGYVANAPANLSDPLGLCPGCATFMGRLPYMNQFRAPRPPPPQQPRPTPPQNPRQVSEPPPSWRQLTEPTGARRYGAPEWWVRMLKELYDRFRDSFPDFTDAPTGPPVGRKPPDCKDLPPIRSLMDLYDRPPCRM